MALLLNEQERQVFINDYYTLSYVELRQKYKCSSEAIKTTAAKCGMVKKPKVVIWEAWQIKILLEPISNSKASQLTGKDLRQVKKKREQLKINGL